MTHRHLIHGAVIFAAALMMTWPVDVRADEVTSFHDTFDTFDRERWRVSDGWFNGDWQNCTWSNQRADLADGLLILTIARAMAGPRKYTCGEVQTRRRFFYGTYEARIRTPDASGMNAAFFTYIGPVHNAPHNELDIEILTRDPTQVSFNTYVDGKPRHGTTVPVGGRADSNFHTYAFSREPDRIRWFVDGREVHSATGDLPALPQQIYFSLWGTDTLSDWMGQFDSSALPVRMEIDWVAFTAPDERCLFPDSVTCDFE